MRSDAWEQGEVAGADDASNDADYREEVRTGGYYAHRKPAPAVNPFPPGTPEHTEWGSGYLHGRGHVASGQR